MKHTEGEWKVWGTVINAGAKTICNIYSKHEDGEQDANARLITSAPDGLELAEMVEAWSNGLRHETKHEKKMINAARSLIHKTKGE